VRMSVLWQRTAHQPGKMAHVTERPTWWRGESPALAPRGHVGVCDVVTGRRSAITIPPVDHRTGLRDLYVFDAQVSEADLSLDDIHLSVEWSEFEDCHFRQRVRPALNEHGIAAQGSFANSPAVYRNCTFSGSGSRSSAASAWAVPCSTAAPS
jgi:hypothetical protein